jgi:hypothetical protein
MHMNKLKLMVLAVVFSVVGLRADSASADWANFLVRSVGCSENGTCFLILDHNVANHNTCPNKDQARFQLSQPGGAEMYRTALAAYLAGKPLSINTYGGAGAGCVEGYPRVWYLHFAL